MEKKYDKLYLLLVIITIKRLVMGTFRKTKQSDLILDIINNSHDHLSAFEVYNKARLIINNISLGTVYRNLNTLVENNEIRRIKGLDLQDHYDNINISHNHFLCENCQNIYDVFDNPKVSINESLGKVIDYEIYYKGICNNCLGNEN